MRIEEIEAFTKLTRANIHFYEQSGLLTGNGNTYRDYTLEDAVALQKIKLLRMLCIPPDVIKKLQSGRLDLRGVINDRLRQLSMYLWDHSAVDAICRGILEDNVGYAGLDAQKYLSKINELPENSAQTFTIPSDDKATVRYPWRRYFARSIDLSIYTLIWCVIGQLVLRWNPLVSFPVRLAEIYFPFVIMIFIEPLLLSTFGTTPGKLIFGLRVEGINRNYPSYGQALARTWRVIGAGTGYNIVFYNIYRLVKSYKACKAGEELDWEDTLPYTIRDTKGIRILICIAAMIILFTADLFLIFQARMPIHRGELTGKEFTENYNDLIDYYGIKYGQHLDANGTWVDDVSPGSITLNLTPYISPQSDFEITETDGAVTKITFTVDRTDANWVLPSGVQMYFATLAFVGAQREISCLDVLSKDFTGVLSNNHEDFSFTKAGITVTYTVEYSGYLSGSSPLVPKENTAQNYHAVFTMERS